MNLATTTEPYPVYSIVGDRYTFLLTGSQTDGAYFVFEGYVLPGNGTPPHIHHREDEAFYVIEGDFEFTVAGKPIRVRSGEFISGRKGIPHHFKNVGSTTGRLLITATPAGLENFFAEIGTPLKSRREPPVAPSAEDIAKLQRTASKYGLELLPPA